MKTVKQIFQDWKETYGETRHTLQGALYDAGLMFEFAQFYHKEMLKTTTNRRKLLFDYEDYLQAKYGDSLVSSCIDEFLEQYNE